MTSKPLPPTALGWRDDVATPIAGARLADILIDPRETYTAPDRLSRHLSLSANEKRLALCAWLGRLLAEVREGREVGVAAPAALAELTALDPEAAAVFRRALLALGRPPFS